MGYSITGPQAPSTIVPPFPAGSGRNGLSVDAGGFLVLGNDVGGAGAVLLNNREIPSAGFDIRFSGAGNLVLGSNASIAGKLQVIGTVAGVQQLTKLPAGQTAAVAYYRVTDSANASLFEINGLVASNVLLGPGVGQNVTTGVENTGLGGSVGGTVSPLTSLTTGSFNTVIGSNCGNSITVGQLNTLVGCRAGRSLNGGNSNTVLGFNAMANHVSSSDNIIIGDSAAVGGAGVLYSSCVIVGRLAYQNPNGGDQNVVVGSSAAAGFTSGAAIHGANNVVIGFQALREQTMGIQNVIIGSTAVLMTSVLNNNILIGYGTLAQNGVDNVTLIGSGASTTINNIVGIGSITQNVLLGFGAVVADNGQRLQVNGGVSFTDVAAMLHSTTAMNNGAAAAAGTLLNAPAAGNPTKWIPFDDAGTTRFIPAW